MNKIEISVSDNVLNSIAVKLVASVIEEGRISKKKDKRYYCWVTRFTVSGEHYEVLVNDNRKHDCFVVRKYEPTKESNKK